MKRLLLTVVLLATFLGGYCVGHRPGSPDIIAWARRAYGQVSKFAGAVSNVTSQAQASGGDIAGLAEKASEAREKAEGADSAKAWSWLRGQSDPEGDSTEEPKEKQAKRSARLTFHGWW